MEMKNEITWKWFNLFKPLRLRQVANFNLCCGDER